MTDTFTRMANSLMARLGVDATLGAATVRVVLEHGVAIAGEYGEVAAYRDVATMLKSSAAKVGDTITIGAVGYKLDGILFSDGYTVRFTLLPT